MTERLYYNKYDSRNPIRKISEEEFYTNLKTVSNTSLSKICVYLTNGANERVGYRDGDGGTTLGFNSIKTKTGETVDLFDNQNFTLIFDSNTFDTNISVKDLIKINSQVAKTKVGGTDTEITAGSVIKVTTTSTDTFPVCGGYHIKGINWNSIASTGPDMKKEKEKESVTLVKQYYTQILNNFMNDVKDTNTFYILHLAQIPGGLFGGTEITGDAMHDTVKGWLEKQTAKNFMISIDFAEPPPGKKPLPPPHSLPSKPVDISDVVTKGPLIPSNLSHLLEIEMAHATGKPAFKVIENIYNVFFKTAHDNPGRTKDALTASIVELMKSLDTAGVDAKYTKALTEIKTSLDSTDDTKLVGKSTPAKNPGPAKNPDPAKKLGSAASPIKYVFAFDVDSTLVSHGSLYTGTFDSATNATNYDEMLKLMNDIIGAGHYVWIVTASDQITKANFEKLYLKNNEKITKSGNYYFMNPGTVKSDLKGTFIPETFKPLLTNPVTPEQLTYNTDVEFQTNGLKPYAMLAKWIQSGFKPDNVKMYLFDDNDTYKSNCENCKGNKVEFVKITGTTGGTFTSDILKKATEKFEEVQKAATSSSSSSSSSSSDVSDASSICVLDDTPGSTVTDEKTRFKCKHSNLCSKYTFNEKTGTPPKPTYFDKNVVGSCMAILIYDGRDAAGKNDENHGKILLASEHVPYKKSDETSSPREYNVFGGSIENDKGKCPLQALYDEVAEEGRFLEIGKNVEENASSFNDIFKDKTGNFLTEPCVHKKALYFIGVVKKGMSIWDVDGVKHNPGKSVTWTGEPTQLTDIFAKINNSKGSDPYVYTYGEKNMFRFFSDDEIDKDDPKMYGQTRTILKNKDMKKKIAEVQKNAGITTT
jgi:hypothetical protein